MCLVHPVPPNSTVSSATVWGSGRWGKRTEMQNGSYWLAGRVGVALIEGKQGTHTLNKKNPQQRTEQVFLWEKLSVNHCLRVNTDKRYDRDGSKVLGCSKEFWGLTWEPHITNVKNVRGSEGRGSVKSCECSVLEREK